LIFFCSLLSSPLPPEVHVFTLFYLHSLYTLFFSLLFIFPILNLGGAKGVVYMDLNPTLRLLSYTAVAVG
jgi:hypothetical protein